MDFKTLIYSKGFDNELTHRLLHIADSKTWLEDLIDLIGENYNEKEEECNGDCDIVDEIIEQKEEIQGKLNAIESEICAKITALRGEMGIQGSDLDNIMGDLADTIDEYVNFRLEKMENARKITVGGIELPEKRNSHF